MPARPAARFAALKSGAVDAALLTTPFNFFAETEGFRNLGFTFDYLPEIPFAAMAVNRDWAKANPDLVKRFVGAYNKGVTWFDDPHNREAAIAIQAKVSRIRKSRRREVIRLSRKQASVRADRKGLKAAGQRRHRSVAGAGRSSRRLQGRTGGASGRDADVRLANAAAMSATSEGFRTASGATAPPAADRPRRLITALRAHYLAGLLSVAGGLAIWEIVSRFVVNNALFLAAPLQIIGAIIRLRDRRAAAPHRRERAEFILGYVIASVLGIALGVGMAASSASSR